MIDLEDVTRVEPPGSAQTGYQDSIIPVPFAATSASALQYGSACVLMGWSIRESTGLAGAMVELISGSSSAGELLATVALNSGFDLSAAQTPLANTASGANAVQTATITPAAGVFAFVTSLRITGLGATGATVVTATLAGVQGSTISYPVTVPAGATTAITPVTDAFGTRGLQGSAAGGAITLTLPAFGAGNTLELAELTGYGQQPAGAERTESTPGPGLLARNGVFLNVVSGSVKGTLWVKV